MALLSSGALTLLDFSKRIDPDGNGIAPIVELLDQENPILADMIWKEGNLPTGNQTTTRVGLPAAVWRKLNAGIPKSKSITAQIMETCAMLEALAENDKAVIELNGNSAAFRASENAAFISAMNNTMSTAFFYGDATLNPEQFTGLAPRYSTIAGATNGQNIIDGGGTGSNNTSIWLVGWGERSVFGIYPKGTTGGLQHTDYGDKQFAFDAAGNRFPAYIDHYVWRCGIALADWRYVARIANLNVANLISGTGSADLIVLMSRLIDRLPNKGKGVKPVFYMNRTVASILKIQALAKSNNAVKAGDALTQFTDEFLGIPIRVTDAILNTEARVV